jgi:hypothetical protein
MAEPWSPVDAGRTPRKLRPRRPRWTLAARRVQDRKNRKTELWLRSLPEFRIIEP